jgi:hypothetical protein
MRYQILISLLATTVAVSCSTEHTVVQKSRVENQTKTYMRSEGQDLVLYPWSEGKAEPFLQNGMLVRICRPVTNGPTECRYIVPADPAENTVTAYHERGLSGYRDGWSNANPSFYVNRGKSFRVCRMPIVTDPSQKPPCETLSPAPTPPTQRSG